MSETTLRDTISALVDKSEAGEPLDSVTPPTESKINIPAPDHTQQAQDVESEEEKAGRTAGRSRDEKGRLLPGKAGPQVQQQVQGRPPRPSSWKKDYWDDWEKLDPKLAGYIHERESDYARGVSTYKQEWEQARPLLEAIAPFLPTLQQHNISPDRWISGLGKAHHMLANGNPQERLQMFHKLAQDYRIPLQALYDQGFAQQFVNQYQPPYQPPQPSVEALVGEKMSELFSKHAVTNFGEAKDDAGNPRYPYFEQVRPKMAQLLENGLANDLESAYTKALRIDDDLWQAEQQRHKETEEKTRLQQNSQAVQVAKRNAISPKSATPASGGAGTKKGLRDQLSESYDAVVGGRV